MNIHDHIVEPYLNAESPDGYSAKVYHKDDKSKTVVFEGSIEDSVRWAHANKTQEQTHQEPIVVETVSQNPAVQLNGIN